MAKEKHSGEEKLSETQREAVAWSILFINKNVNQNLWFCEIISELQAH